MEFRNTSYFNQNFQITAEPFTGVDFSKKAFVFPGQGSSVPGMFKVELKKHPEFQELFAIADRFSEAKGLGKVTDYINQHEAIDKKHLPYIRNMALFVSQVALYRYLQRMKMSPGVLTSYSFGEYAILTCAGALDFETMLEVVYRRDYYSPGINEAGALVAISSNENEIGKLSFPCEYVIANINSPQQVVLAVAQKDFKSLNEFLKKNRIPARPMDNVGRPYHSKWMIPTKDKYVQWLSTQNFQLQPLDVDILSSVNRKVYPQGTVFNKQDFIHLLAEQLVQPVVFTEQASILAKLGYHSFIEVGLATVCVGFIKASLEHHEMTSLSAMQFLTSGSDRRKGKSRFNFDTKNNKYFKLVSKYIGDITGYDINDITAGDNFQEDLQIDSIKKAEIVFRVLEESRMVGAENVSISQLHEVGDVVEYLEKIAQAQQYIISKKAEQEFRLLTREWKASSAPLAAVAKISDEQIIEVPLSVGQDLPIDEIAEKLHSGSGKDLKVLAVTVAKAPENFQETIWLGQILKSFADLIERSPLTYQELKVFLYGTEDAAIFRGLKAFFKSLAKETKKFNFKSVLNYQSTSMKELLRQEMLDVQAPDVMFKDQQRWTLHFKEIPAGEKLQSAVIFSVGGTKGILKAVYEQFAADQKCHLVIMGRSGPEAKAVQATLKKIKKHFKSVEYIQGDVRSFDSLSAAVQQTQKQHGRIDLFINSAGVEVSKGLIAQTEQEVLDQLQSKFESLNNLLKIKSQHPSAQLISFSSVVAHFGNEGQTIYSFANAYLDTITGCRHIHWPPMDGIGMTENPGILQKLRSMGVSLMNEKQASELFNQSLQRSQGQDDVFYLDLKDLYMYEYNLRNPGADRKVFGDLADPGRLSFAKSYDFKNDSYLRDHHIESTSVVAAATGMAAFMSFGEYYFKHLPMVEDFEIKNMILVSDRENFCIYQPEFVSTQEIKMKLLSQLEHFTGTLRALKGPAIAPAMSKFKATQTVEMDSFYSVRSIDYGPKFQVMGSAYYDEQKNVVAVGKQPFPYLTGVTLNDYLSYLVELSFQAIYLKNVLLSKGLGIPLRIRKIQPENFYISETVYVVPTAHTEGTDEKMIYGGAVVYDGKGQALLTIEGVEMSTIRLYENSPFESKPSNWEFRGV